MMYRISALVVLAQLGLVVGSGSSGPPPPTNGCVDRRSECDTNIPTCDVCDLVNGNKNKPSSITFRYNANQGTSLIIADGNVKGKHEFVSGVGLTGSDLTNVNCDTHVVQMMGNNEFVVFPAGDSSVECEITSSASGRQVLSIHTSCSAPLSIGDQFASLTLIGFTGATSCPLPPCELCCDSAPAFTAPNRDVYVDRSACVGDLFNTTSPAFHRLRDFVTGTGVGFSCTGTNPESNVVLFVRRGQNVVPITPDPSYVIEALGGLLCADAYAGTPYCPDTTIEFGCQELCTPSTDAYSQTINEEIVAGSASFHVGYQNVNECPDAPIGSCDVCFARGSKNKPTSIVLRYDQGQPATLTIQGGNQKGKHTISGAPLSGNLQSISCKDADVSIAGNLITLSNLDSSGIECSITSGSQVQTVDIHVSCSAPLDLGDRYGALTLVDFSNYAGSASSQCQIGPKPPCELCVPPACDSSPATTPAASDVYTDHTPGFSCTGPVIDAGPVKDAFKAWYDSFGGGTCETTNNVPDARVVRRARQTPGAGTVTYSAAEALLCAEQEFCPEITLEFVCNELCDPTDSFGTLGSMGESTFHVGYEEVSECPGPVQSGPNTNCQVCFPDGNTKVKPTGLTFTYAAGQPVSNTIQLSDKPDKHVTTGSVLNGAQLTSASCDNGVSAQINGNVLTISGISKSETICVLSDGSSTQTVNIHTSCSASINIGDRFGALTLIDFANGYGTSTFQCRGPPPPPPPPCPLCADPCVNMPAPHVPGDTSVTKEGVCETIELGQRVLPTATELAFQQWLDSYTCTLNNPTSAPAQKKYFVVRNDELVEFTSVSEVADILCNPGGDSGDACHFIDVTFECCDPCRPEDVSVLRPALCQSDNATFSITDTTEPTIPWQPQTAECAQLGSNANAGRPFPADGVFQAWLDSAVCRDNGENIIGDPDVVFEEVGRVISGDSCQTTVAVTRGCKDECQNERLKTVVFTVEDTTKPNFSPAPQNGSDMCTSTDTTAYDVWKSSMCGAGGVDDCSGTVSAITSTIVENRECVLDQDAVSVQTVTITDACGLSRTEKCYWTRTNVITPPVIDPPPEPPTPCTDICADSTEACDCEIKVDECEDGPIENDGDGLAEWFAVNANLTCHSSSCGGEHFLPNPFIFSDYRNTNGCERKIVARFTCEDACGQQTAAWATYIIKDTTPPFIIEPLPASTTNECQLERSEDMARAAWIADYSGKLKWADDLCQANPVCFQPDARAYKATEYVDSFCTNDYDPVCADGVTYTNNCHCTMNGHQTYLPGACPNTPPPPPPPPSGNACADACGLLQSGSGPICYNGVQYDNTCYLYCEQVYWGYTNGNCDSSPTEPPSYATPPPPSYAAQTPPPPTYTYTPPPYASPSAPTSGGVYQPPSDPCHYCMGYTREVCGSDGVTYSSACHAVCNGAVSHTLGGCYVNECGISNIDYSVGDFVTNFFIAEIDMSSFYPVTVYTNHNDVSQDVLDFWAGLGRPLPKCKITDTYTFFADDGCTDPISQEANYSVVDETAPVITPAEDMVFECDAVNGAQAEWKTFIESRAGAECSDDCQDGCIWFNPRYADGSPAQGEITDTSIAPELSPCDTYSCDLCAIVTFTASDGCANLVETTAEFRVVDTTAPEFSVAEKVEQCLGAYPVAFFEDFGVIVDESTECNLPATAYDPHFLLFGNPYHPPYGWSTIMPPGVNGVPPAYLPDDEWNIVAETFSSYVQDGTINRNDQQCPFITIATIKVEDSCGNVREENATHVFLDSTPPGFAPLPQDLTLECTGPNTCVKSAEFKAWLEDGGGGRCADECTAFPAGNEIPTYNADIPELTGTCPGTLEVEFTCTDFCGNTATHTATVFVVDTTPPAALEVIDATRQCGEEHTPGHRLGDWLADRGSSGASDACSDEVTITQSPNPVVPVKVGRNKCNDTSARVCWTYADECGNSAEECGYYNVTDTNAPVVTGGFDLDFTCNADCSNAETKAMAVMNKWLSSPVYGCHEATDCQEDMTWTNDFTFGPKVCGTEGTVDFTVTDACGNAKTVTRNYIFRKYEPSNVSPPPPATCTICGGDGAKRSLKSLTFTWTANSGMPFVAIDSAQQGWTVSSSSVPDGGSVTILGFVKNGAYKFKANTIIGVVSSQPDEKSSIHTSCSQLLFIGQQIQFSNGVLTVSGFETNNGVTQADVCGAPPAPPAPNTEACDLDVEELDVCKCIPFGTPTPPGEELCGVTEAKRQNKPSRLVFRFVGGYTDPEIAQPGKSSIAGGSIDSETATIQCENNKGGSFAQETVSRGGIYTVDNQGSKLGTELECTITGGGRTQVVEIHTSCSAPLVIGDIYGSLQLVCFTSIEGQSCAGGGSGGSTTSCVGPPPPGIPPPPPPAPANCVVCREGGSKPQLDTLTFKYVGGSQLTNPQEGKATVSSGSFGSPELVTIICDTALVPVVTGDIALAKKGKDSGSGGGVSGGSVVAMLGGSFDATKDGAELTCTIQSTTGGLIQEVEIHVSCSKDLAVGDIFGSLQLVGFAGSNGAVTEADACPGILTPDAKACEGGGVDECSGRMSEDADEASESAPVSDPHECATCDCDVCSASGGLPTMLEFEFTGGSDYSSGAESQPLDGPIKLFHGPGYDPSSQMGETGRESIRLSPHEYGVNLDNVPLGHKFRLEAASLDRATLPQSANFLVGRTRVKIVLSCRPGYNLRLGDQWGPLKLVSYKLDAPRSGDASTSDAGHCPASAEASYTTFSGSSAGGSGGAASGVAVAGLVAGLVVIAIIVIGVYRVKSQQVRLLMSDPATSTTDLRQTDELQWDTSINKVAEKLRPRLTVDMEDGEK
eukprot:m.8626 g.8626  ORF g.8626 m.8626 type:complete len:2827 (-) comp2555_c0_seq1:312-8792(-)